MVIEVAYVYIFLLFFFTQRNMAVIPYNNSNIFCTPMLTKVKGSSYFKQNLNIV